jgi:hypothetical protein
MKKLGRGDQKAEKRAARTTIAAAAHWGKQREGNE